MNDLANDGNATLPNPFSPDRRDDVIAIFHINFNHPEPRANGSVVIGRDERIVVPASSVEGMQNACISVLAQSMRVLMASQKPKDNTVLWRFYCRILCLDLLVRLEGTTDDFEAKVVSLQLPHGQGWATIPIPHLPRSGPQNIGS